MDSIVWYIVGVLLIACIIGNIIGAIYLVKTKWDNFWKVVFNKDKQL